MITCEYFNENLVNGDPKISDALVQNYGNTNEALNTASSTEPKDCNIKIKDGSEFSTKRQQKPYPINGTDFHLLYKKITENYKFEVIKESFITNYNEIYLSNISKISGIVILNNGESLKIVIDNGKEYTPEVENSNWCLDLQDEPITTTNIKAIIYNNKNIETLRVSLDNNNLSELSIDSIISGNNSIFYPIKYSGVIVSLIDLDYLCKTFYNNTNNTNCYKITWNNTGPAIINSDLLSNGINDLWKSCTLIQQNLKNLDDLDDLDELYAINSTFNSNLVSVLINYMNNNSSNTLNHKELCEKIDECVLNLKWKIEESLFKKSEDNTNTEKSSITPKILESNLNYEISIVKK